MNTSNYTAKYKKSWKVAGAGKTAEATITIKHEYGNNKTECLLSMEKLYNKKHQPKPRKLKQKFEKFDWLLFSRPAAFPLNISFIVPLLSLCLFVQIYLILFTGRKREVALKGMEIQPFVVRCQRKDAKSCCDPWAAE